MSFPSSITLRSGTLDLSSRCHLMGIVNVTPDSFSDGGIFTTSREAVAHALRLLEEGADILDVGGESTRPGAAPIPVKEEIRRVLPVIEGIRRATDAPVSVDTRNADVAAAALRAGADIVNDVSALRHDERMAEVVAGYNAPVVLMHMLGSPATMQLRPAYTDVVAELRSFFEERMAFAGRCGIRSLLIDPGIGFGKRHEDNLALLRELTVFLELGAPLLVGTSRKSFLGRITGADTSDRLAESISSGLIALLHGASVLRVHEVLAMRRAVLVAEAILRQEREMPA